MREEKKSASAHLPFGDSKAIKFSNPYDFTDVVASSSKTLQSYDAIDKKKRFHCAVSNLKIGNLDLVASISSPTRFAVNDSQGLYLCLMFDGRADADVDGFHGIASANEFAFLSPEVQRTGETTSISMVQLSMLESDVLAVAAHMFGQHRFPALKRSLQRPRNIDLNGKGGSAAAFLKRTIQQIDQSNMDAASLKMLGCDETIYRAIAMMLACDEEIDRESNAASHQINNVVRRVTEFIDAHVGDDLTSTDLEKIAGIGTRALQYAFLKSYGCSPSQWMRGRRLELARQHLLKADRDARIIDVALMVGWRNISSFPSAYAERYGELPSDTLKSHHARL